MSDTIEEIRARAFAALAAPKNEPLNWLMGDALRKLDAWPRADNFLLTALSQPRTGTLTAWNAWIDEFRKLLVNPESAPPKVAQDLRSKAGEVENKLRGVAAEIQAVIELKKRGFSDFKVISPNGLPSVDFESKFDGRLARIEVKNLREPDDHIRMIASAEWRKRKQEKPERYLFNASLRHAHRGRLSSEADRQLRMLIAQFPERNKDLIEILDGGIEVRLERFEPPAGSPEGYMNQQLIGQNGQGRLVVISAFLTKHFEPDANEVQAVFLKAFRVVADAQVKFFSKETVVAEDVRNVLALRWEPPNVFYDPEMLERVGSQIGSLFADFGLQLDVFLFGGNGPEMPWDTLNRYK
jgi:hypothetical protein